MNTLEFFLHFASLTLEFEGIAEIGKGNHGEKVAGVWKRSKRVRGST
jgi:hypothetical protein